MAPAPIADAGGDGRMRGSSVGKGEARAAAMRVNAKGPPVGKMPDGGGPRKSDGDGTAARFVGGRRAGRRRAWGLPWNVYQKRLWHTSGFRSGNLE